MESDAIGRDQVCLRRPVPLPVVGDVGDFSSEQELVWL